MGNKWEGPVLSVLVAQMCVRVHVRTHLYIYVGLNFLHYIFISIYGTKLVHGPFVSRCR